MNIKLTIVHYYKLVFFQVELFNILKQGNNSIVQCYGITKDPKTNNFMMVMEYANNGSLRQHLNNNFNSLNWTQKLENLWFIAYGLDVIHGKGLIHRDFHCGNILNHRVYDNSVFQSKITDLGLCKPVNTKHNISE